MAPTPLPILYFLNVYHSRRPSNPGFYFLRVVGDKVGAECGSAGLGLTV